MASKPGTAARFLAWPIVTSVALFTAGYLLEMPAAHSAVGSILQLGAMLLSVALPVGMLLWFAAAPGVITLPRLSVGTLIVSGLLYAGGGGLMGIYGLDSPMWVYLVGLAMQLVGVALPPAFVLAATVRRLGHQAT